MKVEFLDSLRQNKKMVSDNENSKITENFNGFH